MKRRLIFGPVLIALMLALMWLDERLVGTPLPAWLGLLADAKGNAVGGLILLPLGLLACARGGYELARLFQALNIEASSKSLALSAAAGVLFGAVTIGTQPWTMHTPGVAPATGLPTIPPITPGTLLAVAAISCVLLSMLAYIRHRDPKGAATAVAAAGLSFLYLGLPLAFLLAIRREHSVQAMLAVVFTVKACDSGAYFTGTAIGKNKLIPWLSPGKTWEGLLGGLITSAAFGVGFVALMHAFMPDAVKTTLSLIDGAALGVLLGAVGQAGDLSASVLKRDAGVKDAGRILPGFGGLLDMLDSLIIAGPVAFVYLALR